MNCRTFHALMGRMLDDQLSPEERRQSEGHLANCPHCLIEYRGYVRTVLQVVTCVNDEPDAPLPEPLVQQIVRAMVESPPR